MEQQVEISTRPFDWRKVSLRVFRKDRSDMHIHVLDLDGDMTLTNAADPEFFGRLAKELTSMQPILPEVVTWFLYHTDGYVSSYHGGNDFRHVPLEDPRLHAPFVEVMRRRRETR